MIEALKQFFREDTGEIIGAYFDGDKLYITHSTETIDIATESSEVEQLAEKISSTCKQKGWQSSAVGFCLREDDALTFLTEVNNIPPKDIPALVKSWAAAQSIPNAAYSFAKVGDELWMEAIARARVDEYSAAFNKVGLNLRALSVMPNDMLAKPFDRAKFIAEVVRDKKAPNFLSVQGVWNWRRISLALATIFFIAILIGSAKLFADFIDASTNLDAARASITQVDNALTETLAADIDELRELNNLAAHIKTNQNFNHLINLGRLMAEGVTLNKIRVDENDLELEGTMKTPAAIRNYLARVKASVVQSARLESSSERDDGEIVFIIRAKL